MIIGEENQPSFLPDIDGGAQQPLLPCGGQLIAKINEVDTLFSPGELILLAPIAHRGICPSNHFKIMHLLTEAI